MCSPPEGTQSRRLCLHPGPPCPRAPPRGRPPHLRGHRGRAKGQCAPRRKPGLRPCPPSDPPLRAPDSAWHGDSLSPPKSVASRDRNLPPRPHLIHQVSQVRASRPGTLRLAGAASPPLTRPDSPTAASPHKNICFMFFFLPPRQDLFFFK